MMCYDVAIGVDGKVCGWVVGSAEGSSGLPRGVHILLDGK